ncbi:DUF2062 domain-containing protein [Opitutus terrae]|uniref:DUF2062 domain-containing protein n=1 Tax=Opitutus terrae (strain DSM 11246 / JCM 15787 / PB90-1) TaxID=452637 RepID=B1ZTB9_OPITP|nr:DUF2062 domain-containing protein [Opitutus terrae]ACB76573.1 hypothetical protein Oter_3294 [Opitutus terrae PB90-1]
MHQHHLSRKRLRGGFLHSWLGDRLLAKELWLPTHNSLARAWLVGFIITVIPFLPGQVLLACIACLLIRGNLLLGIALQFLSSPLTAPVHLPTAYFLGELVRGRDPVEVWHHISTAPRDLATGSGVESLYLGALILGVVGGLLGYAIIHHTWRMPHRKLRPPEPKNPVV